MRPHGRGYSSCPGCRVAARAERSGRALPGRPERHRGRGLLQFLGRLWPLGAALICRLWPLKKGFFGLLSSLHFELGSAAAVVPPRKPGWLIGAVPCKIGAPVTGFVLAQGTHKTGCEIAEYRRLCIV